MLEKANEYIRQNRIDEKEKQMFHVTPEVGWMNDPRLLCISGESTFILSILSI